LNFYKTNNQKHNKIDMARQKMKKEEKKKKISICLDPNLIETLSIHLDNINTNRSQYIENLIKKDISQ